MPRSPYEVLEVPKNGIRRRDQEGVPEARAALPPGPEPRRHRRRGAFKEVQSAYDVLSDPEKRQAYDTFGTTDGRGFPGARQAVESASRTSASATSATSSAGCSAGGGGTSARQPIRGDDLETHVRISFEDSLGGAQVRVPVEVDAVCSVCHGTGAEPGTSPIVCPTCGGRGVVSEAQGLFAFSQPCPRCHGNGTIVETPCRRCHGIGRERVTKRYAVKIPAGSKSGTRIRLKGKGEPGRNGGPPGDLYVVVDVDSSPLYERRGSDLVLEVPVTFTEAALGATIQIPTPDGPVALKVPTGTESGKLLRVKGRGVPHLKGSGRGDLLARVKVTVPKKLSKAEREALEGYQKVSRENPRERLAEAG